MIDHIFYFSISLFDMSTVSSVAVSFTLSNIRVTFAPVITSTAPDALPLETAACLLTTRRIDDGDARVSLCSTAVPVRPTGERADYLADFEAADFAPVLRARLASQFLSSGYDAVQITLVVFDGALAHADGEIVARRLEESHGSVFVAVATVDVAGALAAQAFHDAPTPVFTPPVSLTNQRCADSWSCKVSFESNCSTEVPHASPLERSFGCDHDDDESATTACDDSLDGEPHETATEAASVMPVIPAKGNTMAAGMEIYSPSGEWHPICADWVNWNKTVEDNDPRGHIQDAISLGFPGAEYELGWFHLRGLKGPVDYVAALEAFKQAAQHRSPTHKSEIAMRRVGDLYSRGLGVPQNHGVATQWYQEAAAVGDARAHKLVGDAFASGLGVEKDEEAAWRWYQEALTRGCYAAETRIARMHAEGKGGAEKSDALAVEWYKRAKFHRQADASMALGESYFEGLLGLKRNVDEAIRCFERAASARHPGAAKRLGDIYATGDVGVPQCDGKACKWYEYGAEHGDPALCAIAGKFCVKIGLGTSWAMKYFELGVKNGCSESRENIQALAQLGESGWRARLRCS